MEFLGRRRQFITLLGGAATWPLTARAQQGERMRRIGVLMNLASDDVEEQARLAAFQQELSRLGWNVGGNLRIDYRWGAANADRIGTFAEELVALAPDVILSMGSPSAAALQRATRTVPIVFVTVVDPVGSGFVDNLARPGGNITGFTLFEYSISGKWLELLKEIAPGVSRAAVMRDPTLAAGGGQLGAIQAVAPLLGMEAIPVNVRDVGEIERAITNFAQSSNGGLIVTGSTLAAFHRDLIKNQAIGGAEHRCKLRDARRCSIKAPQVNWHRARSRLCRECDGFLVTFTLGHDGPSHPCNLIGERERGNLRWSPRQ
jgi:putative ABC transport system substrate-binding protein